MGDRMLVQVEVMKQLGGISRDGGHSLPGKNFKVIAENFPNYYTPDERPEAIAKKMQDELNLL